MPETRRIALFGGTFDPVHLGHLQMAEIARHALHLDEVRFIPCRISPHKPGSSPTSPGQRVEMLRLATAGLPWAVVDDWETRRDGPSYSWQTAEAMKVCFPEARLFWILGGDQWQALPDWAKPERLAACVEFIVFSRGKPPEARAGFAMHPLTGDHPASATRIRQDIAAGKEPHPWLQPAVAAYIRTHRLYQ